MSRGSDDGDDGSGDLADKVSTFGAVLEDLGDAELRRKVEEQLEEEKRRYEEPAEEYLRRQEERYKAAAEEYLGFDRGDVVDGAGDRGDGQEVDRGGD